MQRDMYLCFIDFENIFDRVKHEELLDISKGKALRIVYNL